MVHLNTIIRGCKCNLVTAIVALLQERNQRRGQVLSRLVDKELVGRPKMVKMKISRVREMECSWRDARCDLTS